MSGRFSITYRKNNGNLYVHPKGVFDGNSAWELFHLLNEQYDGSGRIFIETKNLKEMNPFGCSTFRCLINLERVPIQQLFFKGEKGFDIAVNGSKVLMVSKKKCHGNCNDCADCPNKKHKHHN